MTTPLVLASSSTIRATLLRNAGVTLDVVPVRVDEAATKAALLAENASHRDIADALAELKSRRGALKHPDALVLGADQVLSCNTTLFDKAQDQSDLAAQLKTLSGQVHMLYSAAVIYAAGKPVWRHIGQAQMIMRPLSDDFITQYVAQNWPEIQYCVGGYQLEGVGAQLFTRVQGDYFSVLGLPLLEILGYLRTRGALLT